MPTIHLSFDLELRRNPYRGMYLAIEGPDGSGKSTQIKKLENYFTSQGKTVVITGEPNDGSTVGKFIRRILSGEVSLPATTIQYLMSADRADNHESIVYPALEKGYVVLSHRSFWSAVPYGLLDKGININSSQAITAILMAQGILSLYHQFIAPDITFYLDIPVDTAMERMKQRGGKAEIYEKKNKIRKIIDGYYLLLRGFPEEFSSIDASGSVEEVTDTLLKSVKNYDTKIKE